MLRWGHYQKKEAVGKAEGRQEAYAPVRDRAGSERSIPRCAEDGQRLSAFYFVPSDPAVTACFTGHRLLSRSEDDRIRQRLKQAIARAYDLGYRVFLDGGALGFDTLAAEETLRARELHPDIQLRMILPCRSQPSGWAPEDQEKYFRILGRADDVLWLSEKYYEGCMLLRNRYMISHASRCICYLKDRRGGTLYTVSLACRNGLDVDNLAMLAEKK